MSIRPATPEDSVKIAQLLRAFYDQSGGIYGIPYDHASTIRTVLDVIVRGVCLVGHSSCAGAIIAPFPYNVSARVAQVAFWYFVDRKEICIFDQLYEACKQAGATHINATALPPKQTGKRFYQVRGMELAEFQYLGPLTKLPCKSDDQG